MATAPIAYPLGPPALDGRTLTVDTALNQPTRITRRISDITLQNFITTQVFATGGTVSGGAVVYDEATVNELYTDRDVESRAPGDEYPIVAGSAPTPRVASVEDWGGKFFITDEARDRNDTAFFNNQVTQLANTITRKVNQRAVDKLDEAITRLGGAQVFTGQDWGAAVTNGVSPTPNRQLPAADFAKAQLLADQKELGVTYDLWLLNPVQAYQLAVAYGADLGAVLAALNITYFSSNRVPVGTGYAVAKGQVGELRLEQALGTETWREQATRRNWVQSSVKPVVYVTNPYSVVKVTGLGTLS